MNLDPSELGWHEFWLRIAVIVFVGSVILLAFAVTVRIVLTVTDVIRWIFGKGRTGKTPSSGAGNLVYVSEYDGKPPGVHLTQEAAMAACEGHLKDEKGSYRWDWVPDEYGWVMREQSDDPESHGALLWGKVTRTHIASD